MDREGIEPPLPLGSSFTARRGQPISASDPWENLASRVEDGPLVHPLQRKSGESNTIPRGTSQVATGPAATGSLTSISGHRVREPELPSGPWYGARGSNSPRPECGSGVITR